MRGEYYILALIGVFSITIIVLISHQASSGFSLVYFDNGSIPLSVEPLKNYTIFFIIESHEHISTNYTYSVYLDGNLIMNDTVLIKPQGFRQVPVSFSVNSSVYDRIILWRKVSRYNVTNLVNISGQCGFGNGSVFCLPPLYPGPADLNLILNTSGDNVVVSHDVENNSSGVITITKYLLNITKLEDKKYSIEYEIMKFQYVPKDITIKVFVKSSTGKLYQIAVTLPVSEG